MIEVSIALVSLFWLALASKPKPSENKTLY